MVKEKIKNTDDLENIKTNEEKLEEEILNEEEIGEEVLKQELDENFEENLNITPDEEDF